MSLIFLEWKISPLSVVFSFADFTLSFVAVSFGSYAPGPGLKSCYLISFFPYIVNLGPSPSLDGEP